MTTTCMMLCVLLLLLLIQMPIALSEETDSCATEITDISVGESFNITTPNYPYFYPNNIDCTWTFIAFESVGSFAIYFLEFDTQRDNDPVQFGKGELVSPNKVVYTVSGVVPSHVVLVIEDPVVWVTFHSDIIGTFTGINLVVERIEDSVPCTNEDVMCNTGDLCIDELLLCTQFPMCLNTTISCDICDEIDFACLTSPGCVDKSMVCDGVRQCLDGSDEWECQTCDSVISNLTVIGPIYLTSPGYPINYPPGTDCTWIFTDHIPGTYIITIMDFATEWWDNFMVGYGTTVSADTQKVRISVWYFPKTFVVNEMDMWVRFAANDAVQLKGFLVEVHRRHEQVACLPDEFECATGYGCLDPALYCNVAGECMDRSDENVDVCVYCSNTTITLDADEKVNIISPFYPSYYPLSVDCFWRVTSEQKAGFISIEFRTVSLSYRNDYLTIGYGEIITDSAVIFRLTGTGGPRFSSVNDSSIWLRLTTDQWGQNEIGFYLTIQWQETFTPCAEGEFLCGSGYGCLESHYVCDSIGQCLDGSDEDGCALCGVQLEFDMSPSDVFNISSPWYPRQYPLTQDCHWQIMTSSPGNIIATFMDFDTGPGHDKLYFASLNSTILYDVDAIVLGDEIYRFTGRYFPRSVIIPWSSMQIAWDASVWTAGGRGFALEISWKVHNESCRVDDFICPVNIGQMCLYAEQKCDGRVLCPTGLDEQDCGYCGPRNIFISSAMLTNMTSPKYPLPYPPDLDCQWVIVADHDQSLIVARVKFFDLEREFDFLAFGNGPEGGMDEITKLSGQVKVKAITSFMSTMWIALKTDKTGNMMGYRLELEQIRDSAVQDVCELEEYHCGSGFCVTFEAKCNGFADCFNEADEQRCAYITCPGSYLCDKVPDVNISKCVTMTEVCDGDAGCPGGDDETLCHLKRCPEECECAYDGGILQVHCTEGWSGRTIENMARTVNTLKLTSGDAIEIEPGLFKGLAILNTLSLEANNVGLLQQGVFDGLANLTWLDLSHNNMSTLRSNIFDGLPQLKELYLSDVPISAIHTDAFSGMNNLDILVMIRESGNDEPVDVFEGGFRGLNHLRMLYVDDRFLCCHFDNLDECVTLEPQPPLFMCGSLMQNFVLRVSMWVLGISALIGNVYVVVVRATEDTKSANQAKQTFLVGNLAVSDCQMGVYMLILASVDLYYGDEYFIHSDQWRSSKLCKFASFLSLLSSEASVFFITLISLDRFVCILFPFNQIKLRRTSTKVAAAIIWAIAFGLAIAPTLTAGPESDFYDLSDVCIGLPLITRPSSYSIQSSDVGGAASGRSFDLPVPAEFKPAWYFSIAIFLGINLVCFLTILLCYIAMFIYVKMSRKQVQQSTSAQDDIKIAIKMAAIVGTDFICWMPVIIMGILSQTGAAVIPLQMYTWSVVFILPINSSLNPYLYTIASVIGDARKSTGKKSISSVSRSQTKHTSITDTTRSESNIN